MLMNTAFQNLLLFPSVLLAFAASWEGVRKKSIFMSGTPFLAERKKAGREIFTDQPVYCDFMYSPRARKVY
jgi:hypothetical protein